MLVDPISTSMTILGLGKNLLMLLRPGVMATASPCTYHNTSMAVARSITLDADGLEPLSNVTVNLYGGAANRFTLVGNPLPLT